MKNNIQNCLDNNKIKGEKPSNQGELAKLVGSVDRPYINRIANGKITPTVPLAMRIALALNKTMEEVFILE